MRTRLIILLGAACAVLTGCGPAGAIPRSEAEVTALALREWRDGITTLEAALESERARVAAQVAACPAAEGPWVPSEGVVVRDVLRSAAFTNLTSRLEIDAARAEREATVRALQAAVGHLARADWHARLAAHDGDAARCQRAAASLAAAAEQVGQARTSANRVSPPRSGRG